MSHALSSKPCDQCSLGDGSNKPPESLDAGFNIPVILTAFAASLSSLNFGWCLGEPNIPEDAIKDCIEGAQTMIHGLPTCLPMNSTIWGLVVGLVALGALVGSLAAGHAADHFGRKKVLLVNNFFFISGAVLLGTSTTVVQLAIGRFISGIGCGVASTVVATYNSECSPVKVRGFIGAILQLSVELGIFLAQLIAIFTADVPNWRILFGLSGAISLVQLIWLPFMPESPKYLVRKRRIDDAENALRFLRPGHNVSDEIQLILDSVGNSSNVRGVDSSFSECSDCEIEDAQTKAVISDKQPEAPVTSIGIADIVRGRTPDVIWHTLFCTLFLMGFQQWSGAKGVVFYSTEIMEKVFRLTYIQAKHTPNSAQWVTIGIAATGVIAVLASMFLIDRFGRRRLLLISTGGLVVSCILIVVGCSLDIDALAVFATFAFKTAYGLGLAPIPWLSASEMLPYYVLGILSGIASGLNWLMIFIIGLLFPVLSKTLGDYLFLPFAVLNALAFVTVFLFVPETKGRHINDILYHHGKKLHIVASFTKQVNHTYNNSSI
ncbi:general substrate transporter [Coemansia mojavensis]|nr:general substrate transporter [Coemansia mojavensis]